MILFALTAHAQSSLKKGKPMTAPPPSSAPWVQVEWRDIGIQSFRCALDAQGYQLHYSGDMGSRTFSGKWAIGEYQKIQTEFKALEPHLRDETDADRKSIERTRLNVSLSQQGKAKFAEPKGEAMYQTFIKNCVELCRKKAAF